MCCGLRPPLYQQRVHSAFLLYLLSLLTDTSWQQGVSIPWETRLLKYSNDAVCHPPPPPLPRLPSAAGVMLLLYTSCASPPSSSAVPPSAEHAGTRPAAAESS
jgi:hypothetical protein